MNLIEMVKTTGCVPSKAVLNDGTTLEIFIRKRTKGDYIASLWNVDNGVQTGLVAYGIGKTPDKAKEDLKNLILSEEGGQG